MAFFSNSYNEPCQINDMEAFQESCMIAELMAMPFEDRQAIFESESYALLEKHGLIGKKTRVQLSKEDDLDRRETMAAFQLAKEANDSLWNMLALNRVKERDLIRKIKNKYAPQAKRAAIIGQRDYIKTIRQGGTIKKSDLNNRA